MASFTRRLYPVAFSQEWGRQMRMITGPRQAGKTTLAKDKLGKERSPELYYLWDLRSVRNRYKSDQLFFTADRAGSLSHPPWVCFDEIHKLPKWKNVLKGIFDSVGEEYRFIVTGSAKFEIFKKAGDSLTGRYFTFHLFPLSLSELRPAGEPEVPGKAEAWIQAALDTEQRNSGLEDLLEFGGFPEPFLRQSRAFSAKWSRDYADTVVQEDIGALTRIIDKEYLYDLYRLLPEMVGSPLSETSLAGHLEISAPTVKGYLRRLEDFYLAFKVHPYSKNIKRALLKSPKAYIFDWTSIADPGKRFENYVAVELLSRVHLWREASGREYSLYYVRTKEKEETDFLVLRDKRPWLLIECKLTDGPVAGHHRRIQAALGGIPLVQLSRQESIRRKEAGGVYRLSASRLLGR